MHHAQSHMLCLGKNVAWGFDNGVFSQICDESDPFTANSLECASDPSGKLDVIALMQKVPVTDPCSKSHQSTTARRQRPLTKTHQICFSREIDKNDKDYSSDSTGRCAYLLR